MLTILGYSLHFVTGRGIKSLCSMLRLAAPADVVGMYLAGEPAEYIEAAVMAVNQSGE